jgi:hypothetical protein
MLRCPRFEPYAALTAALLCLLTSGTPEPAVGSTIKFRWPLPAQVSVSMSDLSESSRVVLRWDMRVDTTTSSDELRVGMENVEILETEGVGSEMDPMTQILAGLDALSSMAPPFVISRGGEYLRPSMEDDAVDRALEQMRSAWRDHVPTSDSLWSRARALLHTPDRATLAPIQWNLWSEDWAGFDLESRAPVTGKTSVLVGDRKVPGVFSVRRLSAPSAPSDVAWIEQESVYEGDPATRGFEDYLRSQMRSRGETDLPEDPIFRSIRRVDRATVALEPNTARPSYARFERHLELIAVDGTRFDQQHLTEYLFEWAPPMGRRSDHSTIPDSVQSWFRARRFEDASRALVKAVAEGSRQPEVHAMLGEVYRRMDRPGDAVLAGRRALSIDPCNAFAHQVLADAYRPSYGSWYHANSDSSWNHLLQGIACDSTDGNLWTGAYIAALERNRPDLARRSLRSLYASKFFTPGIVAYARWMVQGLPDRALLLTNGDLDSYPLWCLQEAEGFRPGIAVVNTSLLNLPWYARYIRDRYGIPLPFKDAQLDSLPVEQTSTGTLSDRIIDGWAVMRRYGLLGNPLYLSVTLSAIRPEVEGNLRLIGASWEYVPNPARAGVDTVAVRRSLESIRPTDLRGPAASERDRSPIRHSTTLANNVVSCRLQYARALGEAGRHTAASREITQARLVAQELGIEREVEPAIEAMRAYLERSK